MEFIKLGQRYINVAMITDVFIQEPYEEQLELQAEIYLSAPMGERSISTAPLDVTTRHFHVSGDEADKLIAFLEEHTERA